MKHRLFSLVLAAGVLATSAFAQEAPPRDLPMQIEPVAPGTPVFRDNILTIPNGTVIDDNGAVHFRNIKLIAVSNDTFRVASAQQGHLAEVDTVEVLVDTAGDKAEVTISGALSSACVDVIDPVVSQKDSTFTIVLAETAPTAEACILMLVYYESKVELDTSELEAGDYKVVVNGVESGFTL